MYRDDDVARSVRRHLAEWLGPPWVLNLERVEVADDDRPAGLIEVGIARARAARAALPQGNVTEFAPVSIALYPPLAEPREAGRAARDLASGLRDLLTFGADGPLLVSGRPASGPFRLPLYDYAAVPLAGSAAERRGPERAHDVLWVEDQGVRPVQDPMDARRWSVIADLRVSWERPGAVRPGDVGAPLAARMPGSYAGETPGP